MSNAARKSLVITGAGRGIGAATARLAARQGYGIGVAYRSDQAAAAAVVAEIVRDGGRACAVRVEVSHPTQVGILFEQVESELGPIAGLVNNAGISGGRVPFLDTQPDAFRRVLDVNLMGIVHCSQAAARRMDTTRGGPGGAIVNLSSQAVRLGGDRLSAYVASKGAVEALTRSMARELAPLGIRVNAVSPGIIATQQNPTDDVEWATRAAERIPLGRIGAPEEVATCIAWLLSDDASYVTGMVLPVAGGR